MNKWRFSPKKDYNANRLSSGLLQLTDGEGWLRMISPLVCDVLSFQGAIF